MTVDRGVAPCVENGILTLACCKGGQIRNNKIIKTGLRYRIGSKKDADYENDNVYILGIHKNKFLYLAKVTKVITMKEYFSDICNGRTDGIYSLKDGVITKNNHLRSHGIHIDPNENIRDIAGEYVLMSEDFIYLGADAVFNELILNMGPKFRETKLWSGIDAEIAIAECLKYKDNKKHTPTSPLKKKSGGCK